MTAVPPEKAGGASAINQMTRQLGQALGVAIGGSIAASGYRRAFERPPGLRAAEADRAGASITGALEVARSAGTATGRAVLDAAHLAFLHGVRLALVVAAGLAVAGAVYAARAIPSDTGVLLDAGDLAASPDLIVEA